MRIQHGLRETDDLVIKFPEPEFSTPNSKNKLTMKDLHLADTNHWNFVAATKATEVRLSYDELG
jgi:hypothetical protein